MNYLYFINIKNLTWLAIESRQKILPRMIQYQIEQFKFEQDKCRALMGKVLLLYILRAHEGYQAEVLPDFSYNRYQKPEIAGLNGGFNISHAGEWVVCGYNTQGSIGVDVEKIVPFNISDYREVLTANEYQYAINDTEFNFYQLWTLKEAIIKADGRGFFLSPKTFEIPYPFKSHVPIMVDGSNWFLYSTLIDSNYYLSIASATGTRNNIQFKQLFFGENF